MPPVSPQTLRLLRQLEIPDCGCPIKLVPLCVRRFGPQGCRPACVTNDAPGGCENLYEDGHCDCPKGDCECPMTPGEACEHVKARWHRVNFFTWARLVALLDPDEMPPPGAPCLALETKVWRRLIARRVKPLPPPLAPSVDEAREARVCAKIDRHERGYGLWHPRDVKRSTFPGLTRLNFRLRSGADVQGELVPSQRKAA